MTVVLRSDEGVFSLLAVEVNDVIEAPLSAMAPPPAHLDARLRGLVRHVLRTPDGLLLVLDVPGIVSFLKADGRL
jgi:chemotaxis signal transduction protein